MILHIPHSGTEIGNIPVKDSDILRGTDWYVDQLFSHQDADVLVQPYSRFICDCERLPDEVEPLYNSGYGITYKKDFDGNPFNEYDEMLSKSIYTEHHKVLNSMTRKQLCYIPVVYIVDCHSFSNEQLESDVDFCIGFNDDFTDFDMLQEIVDYLKKCGYKIGINEPYSNAIVPSDYINNPEVKSIMIEINKRLYLKEGTNIKSDNFNIVEKDINNILTIISKQEEKYDDFQRLLN